MVTIPSITVVMPAHNTEKFIAPAIKSILNQTFTDFELWVLENGSTDRTADVAEEFSDSRVKVFRLGAVGFQGALSYALHNAKSDWIARMDSDDVCLPTRLERQANAVKEMPKCVMVGTAYAILTPFGHVIERRKTIGSRELDKTSVALGGHTLSRPQGRICADASMLFNRKAALSAGGYDPSFRMGDVPLWLRMLSRNKGWELSEALYLYRLRPRSFSSSHDEGVDVRAKYAPELLEDFLSVYGGTLPRKNGKKGGSPSNFWRHIGFLELLAGDRKAAGISAANLHGDGNRLSALALRMRSSVGPLGSFYYKRKWAFRYRHRPDLESQIRHLLGNSIDGSV